MHDKKYVFAGNRFFVVEKMLQLQLHVEEIFAVKESYLERELHNRRIPFTPLTSKKQLIEALYSLNFDFFISNGCPFILPISKLTRDSTKKFINIHPSLLPDLRGADPVPGALFFGRRSGVTCHVMDDEIDSGDIIAQIPIEITECLDCGLLYQLSFIAEQEVFIAALKRNFEPIKKQTPLKSHIYYTLKNDDLRIDFSEDDQSLLRKIKAFNTHSQGAFFYYKQNKIKVLDAEIVTSPFLIQRISNYKDNEVVFNYEKRLLIRKNDKFVKLKQLVGDVSFIKPGDILS